MLIGYIYPFGQISFHLFVIAALLSLATFTLQFREAPGAKAQICGLVCKGFWLLSIVMASLNSGLSGKMLWITLQQMAALLSSYLWFELVVQISKQDQNMPTWIRHGFWGLIGCLWLAILTNPWHGFFLQTIWIDGQIVRGMSGPVFVITKISSYIFCAVNLLISLRWVLITRGLRRKQAGWITVSGLFSLFGAVSYYLPNAQGIAPLPLGFLLAGLFVTWSFYRWQVYNILPLAQRFAIRNMIDALLVVDQNGYIADLNPAAKTLFPQLPSTENRKFEELLGVWPQLAAINDSLGVPRQEIRREYPEGSRYYELNLTSITATAAGGQLLGKVIILKDITQQKQTQHQLLEQQKALSIIAERDRLSREIHDGQGQIWNYLRLELQTIRKMLNNNEMTTAGTKLDQLIGIAKDLHTDARESITGLKNTAASDWDFVANLREYLGWYERNYAILTRITLPEKSVVGLFNYLRQVQLFRIIQEALTNVRKHAQAQHVEVIIEKLEREAIVRIVDDGCGFNPGSIFAESLSYGLKIMKERAEEVGGRFLIESKPGIGTMVAIRFDLEAL